MIASRPIAGRDATRCRAPALRGLWLALLVAIPAALSAAPADRTAIERVIRTCLDGEFAKDIGLVRDSTWPEGYLVSTLEGRPGGTIRRHWRELDLGGIGVYNRTRMARPSIRIAGDRATARFASTTRTYYGADYSGDHATSRNRVELERRHGRWRVLNWYRTSRSFAPDTAWQRRHPR